MTELKEQSVAELIVDCLENEGVEYIFGLPGEENTEFMEALSKSKKIRFILTRHEQGASFIADIYGRLTGKAGVCLSTLGPGAINLLLGVTDAQLDHSPLVAIVAQASVDRLQKESHQIIDLKRLFDPVTGWNALIAIPEVASELVRKAFKTAQSKQSQATALILPEDVAKEKVTSKPLIPQFAKLTMPNEDQVKKAAKLINEAKKIIILAGAGICRHKAEKELQNFVNHCQIPVATTFMAKGVVGADNPRLIGTIGFMRHDYSNFGFDEADLVITVGYDLIEYAPKSWNPNEDKITKEFILKLYEFVDHCQIVLKSKDNEELTQHIKNMTDTYSLMAKAANTNTIPLKLKMIVVNLGAACAGFILAVVGGFLGGGSGFLRGIWTLSNPLSFCVAGLITGSYLGAKIAYRGTQHLAQDKLTRQLDYCLENIHSQMNDLSEKSKNLEIIREEIKQEFLQKYFENDEKSYERFLQQDVSYEIESIKARFVHESLEDFIGHHVFISLDLFELNNPEILELAPKKSDLSRPKSQTEMRTVKGEKIIEMIATHRLFKMTHDCSPGYILSKMNPGVTDCYSYVNEILIATNQVPAEIKRFDGKENRIGKNVIGFFINELSPFKQDALEALQSTIPK